MNTLGVGSRRCGYWWILAIAVVAALLGGGVGSEQTVGAQGATLRAGTILALRGTPHLWIADANGVLHWAGDTRALSGRLVNWGDRREVSVEELKAMRLGDPWLSSGLVKSGEPIYFAKWETDWAEPQLLHIQSIADVELFGINGNNYGSLVFDEGVWERRFNRTASGLQRGKLEPAVGPAALYDPTYEGTIVAICSSGNECTSPSVEHWFLKDGKRHLVPNNGMQTYNAMREVKNIESWWRHPEDAARTGPHLDRIPRGADVPAVTLADARAGRMPAGWPVPSGSSSASSTGPSSGSAPATGSSTGAITCGLERSNEPCTTQAEYDNYLAWLSSNGRRGDRLPVDEFAGLYINRGRARFAETARLTSAEQALVLARVDCLLGRGPCGSSGSSSSSSSSSSGGSSSSSISGGSNSSSGSSGSSGSGGSTSSTGSTGATSGCQVNYGTINISNYFGNQMGVVIDGRFAGYTPISNFRVSPGSHTIRAILDDGRQTTPGRTIINTTVNITACGTYRYSS